MSLIILTYVYICPYQASVCMNIPKEKTQSIEPEKKA